METEIKELNELLNEIRRRFYINPKEKPDQICFSLVYWQRGLWSISITDDWHKWMDAKIDMPRDLYYTPQDACRGFLKFLEDNNIDVSSLQGSSKSQSQEAKA